jgi:hypothetical protein
VSARPSQRARTNPELDALPARIDVPTAASILGTSARTLRAAFNGGHTARVRVGDREVMVTSYRLGRQRWIVTDSLRQVFKPEEAVP